MTNGPVCGLRTRGGAWRQQEADNMRSMLFPVLLLWAQLTSGAVTLGGARFTVYSPHLVRMQYSAAARWEDRPSFTFINPRPPNGVQFTHRLDPSGQLELNTTGLQLRYQPADCSQGLWGGCVRVQLPSGEWWASPALGGRLVGAGNLFGSLTTMDCYLGPEECVEVYKRRMQPGVLSRDGWAVVDDSLTPLWTGWRAERRTRPGYAPSDTDWWFFGHGVDYRAALADFVAVAGPVGLLPRAGYGVWWSRYWPYSEAGIMQVVDGYAEHQLPLQYVVLDMDWHGETPDPGGEPAGSPLHSCNSGWGGYRWNRSLFADPVGFQEEIHQRNLTLVLNTHDQCGVQNTQGAIHTQMVKRLGLKDNGTVPCQFESELYTEALWQLAMESEENKNVDYWWTDLCDLGTPGQGAGNVSNYRCIADQLPKALLWSNIQHATRSTGQANQRRGLVLTVDGGLGNHRYPQVGSGDTNANWTTLEFQVTQTLTAANVAVAWTHDLGGFMLPGSGGADTPANRLPRDPELFLRWVQFGAFSPLFRTHCSHCEIRPWTYPNFDQLKRVYRLRAELLPLVYSCAAKAVKTGVLCVHPVYYDTPELEDAYRFDRQYMLGDHMLVAPIVSPVDSSGRINRTVWLPPGAWVDHWSGMTVRAGSQGKRFSIECGLSSIPVFDRAGSVTPMHQLDEAGTPVAGLLVLRVARLIWPSPAIASEIYVDEGDGLGYLHGFFRVSRIVQTASPSGFELQVDPRSSGSGFPGELDTMSVELVLLAAVHESRPLRVLLNGREIQPTQSSSENCWYSDRATLQTVVSLPALDNTKPWTLQVKYD